LQLCDKPKDRSYPHYIPCDDLLQDGNSDVVTSADNINSSGQGVYKESLGWAQGSKGDWEDEILHADAGCEGHEEQHSHKTLPDDIFALK